MAGEHKIDPEAFDEELIGELDDTSDEFACEGECDECEFRMDCRGF